MLAPTSLTFDLHAEHVVCDIRDRFLGGLVRFDRQCWRAVLVVSGRVIARTPDQNDLVIDGPAIAWLPWSAGMRLIGRAGSNCFHLLLTEVTLANAIGHKPESTDLRDLSHRPHIVRLTETDTDFARLIQCFETIVDEITENGPGTEIVVEVQVRMILIRLWRQSLRDTKGPRPARRQHWILPAFRQLIETHFRNRWTVSQYADAMHITPDRLHDICTRALDRAPSVLVQQRLIYEAQLLLERSSKSIDQIAHDLGFKTAAHFSRAFRTATGAPPARYRKSLQRQINAPTQSQSFADWP
ncbi:AraC family transcriptional regulator [Yoonia sp.]|uniref:AraC family transcriptional regulator n=1 Tax=Yoonia sp. TaxID=2212373 RepID=UPI0025D9DE05|nr:AraC family transcriptional regulator [Yoonia sp.]